MNGERYAVILARSFDETAARAEGPTVHHHRGAAATPRPAFCARQVSRRRPMAHLQCAGRGALASPSRACRSAPKRPAHRPSRIGWLGLLIDPGLAVAFRIRVQPAAPTGLPAPGSPLVHSPISARQPGARPGGRGRATRTVCICTRRLVSPRGCALLSARKTPTRVIALSPIQSCARATVGRSKRSSPPWAARCVLVSGSGCRFGRFRARARDCFSRQAQADFRRP
jgi:hypothetical protein